ncbi:hypothetical protein [Flavobacterium sp.]|uniref:hypothetical protein n=1 Tax=Flavobacterium sp. TaxID=239 RepID=UPI00391B882B
MSIPKLITKTEHLKTAIESIEMLVNDHEEEVLNPIKTYLKQQLEKANIEIDRLKSLDEITTNF